MIESKSGAPPAVLAPSSMLNRPVILAGLMLATFLTAMEATVVSTAMPTIIGELHGLSLYAWVFSVYLLTSTATVPLYGRLNDMVGRKPVMVGGIIIFLIGSALSGQAHDMVQLIGFRALQGLGAGAVQPTVFTILGDMFTLAERVRIQGLFSAVWGTSSVVGPALGAFLTQTVGWRWVFYVNVPFGSLALLIIWTQLRESVRHRQHRLDYLGGLTLTSGVAILLWGLVGAASGIQAGHILLGLALLLIFIAVELRASEPVLPLSIFKIAFIAVPCLAGLLSGAVQFGLSSYVPLFVQGVQLGNAGDAGKVLAATSIGWPLAGFISPRLLLRFGFRPVAITGTALIALGTVALLFYQVTTPRTLMMVNLFVIGVGLGFSSNSFLLAAQSAVGWTQRGVVTASIQFSRTMGGTVGIAVLGAMLNTTLNTTLNTLHTTNINAVLDPTVRAKLPGSVVSGLQQGLQHGLHVIFLVLAGVSIASLLSALLFPRGGQQGAPNGGTVATSDASTPASEPVTAITGGSR
ncbi:MAG: MFS transporter [Chloroflexi bacterium]|nr:MFS transporter [Chloroflexota bacterium]